MKRATYHLTNLSLKGAAPEPATVEAMGDDRYAVTLGGQRHEVSALELPDSALAMFAGHAAFTVEFERKGTTVAVGLKGQQARFDVVDERTARSRTNAGGSSAEGKQLVVSPMPGKVVKIWVKVGDTVTEGQGLVVVEAMKMENELKSPKAGTVTEVFAKEGSAVENGAKLVAVE
jgi:biotin carboxyl carrier protein